jgi:hypothetical protein
MFIGARALPGISMLLLAGIGVAALPAGTPDRAATRVLTGWLLQAAAAEPAHAAQNALLATALDLQQSLTRRLAAAPRDDTSALDAQVADRVIRIETWFYKTNAAVSDSPARRRVAKAWTDYRASLAEALALAREGRVTEVHAAAVGLDATFRRFLVALAVDD